MRRAVFLLLVMGFTITACVTAGARTAGAPGISVTVDKTEVYIGDLIRLQVEVTVDTGTGVRVEMPPDTAPFSIVGKESRKKSTSGEKMQFEFWYDLTCYETGDHKIPVPAVICTGPGGEQVYHPDPVNITVLSLLPPRPASMAGTITLPDIKDIKDPWSWIPFRAYIPLTILIVAATALSTAGLLWWRSKLRETADMQAGREPLPPHETALEELRAISLAGLVEKGLYKQYYTRLSGCLRRYLQEGLGLPALEMTTEEFIQFLDKQAFAAGIINARHREFLADFLYISDLVKFANHVPNRDRSKSYLAAVQEFIADTCPSISQEETADSSRSGKDGWKCTFLQNRQGQERQEVETDAVR